MRVIGEISNPECKITLFHWNNRYLIKLENGLLEQTYKIPEYDLASEADLTKVVNDTFVREALQRFDEMQRSLHAALDTI
jgi:hypothetical protein